MTRQEATRSFRRELQVALRERRCSQAHLARRVRVSQPTIGNWLRGRYVPSSDEVFAIEDALGLVPGALSSHLGYLPVAADSQLGRLFAVLLASAEGRELLGSLGLTASVTASSRVA
jgi:transcriptional regulator with XRE-family HTH domain